MTVSPWRMWLRNRDSRLLRSKLRPARRTFPGIHTFAYLRVKTRCVRYPSVAAVALLPEAVHVDGVLARLVAHRKTALFPRRGDLVVERAELEILPVIDVVRFVGVAGGQEDDLVRRAVVQRAEA